MAPGQGNTMPVKHGESTKKHWKTAKSVHVQHGCKTAKKPDTAAQNIAPGQGNTIPVKDGEATKKCQKPAECVVWNLSKKTKNDVASTATKKYAENSHGSTKHSFWTGKHHTSEGRRSHKEAPKNSLTRFV